MPKCEGLPDGPCPDRKQDNTVKLGEGDLMLCKPCDKVRVEQFLSSKSSTSDASNPIDFAQVSRKKSKTKAQRDKEPNNTVSVQSLDAVTVPTDASASTDDDMNSEMELRQRVEQLTVTVTKQNETITRLSTHLQFVLSFLDIQQTENNKLELSRVLGWVLLYTWFLKVILNLSLVSTKSSSMQMTQISWCQS